MTLVEIAIKAAVEEDRRSRPHEFAGRLDRDCDLCGNPDRDPIHVFSRERLERAIEAEREACAKIADDYPLKEWEDQYKSEIAKQIRARSEGGGR